MEDDVIPFTIQELIRYTERFRSVFAHQIFPNINDDEIPESVFLYHPVTFKTRNIYHVILGPFPDEGIWTVGITPRDA